MTGNPVVVLLAEDNPDHTELVFRGLKSHQVANRIVHVEDGEAALDYLFRRGQFEDPGKSPRPDVVLLDLRMPKVDGLEVLRQMKQCPDVRNIPVVVLTTSEAESDMSRAYELRANSYLVKPLDFEQFCSMMRDLGFYWLAWNRQPALPEKPG